MNFGSSESGSKPTGRLASRWPIGVSGFQSIASIRKGLVKTELMPTDGWGEVMPPKWQNAHSQI
ncbi:MAG: hypothetical protein DHS20C16_28690 [Phycisphaerae bacterium]|nr:MAG: hypothetical protein DHS20C16_28690 [Phycisphaerae bacterium]